MAGFAVPEYRVPTVDPRGAAPPLQIATPPGAFGAAGAQQLEQAGQNLQQASNNVQGIFDKEADLANQTRAQELSNQFVAKTQGMLFTGDDAFYKKTGADAIHAAPATLQALQDARQQVLDQTANETQRAMLGQRIDYHYTRLTDGMARHVAQQSGVWQDAVAKGTIANGTNEAILNYNDPAHVDGNATGVYQTEYDRVMKQTGSPEQALAAGTAARSRLYVGVISQYLTNGQQRMALQTYDRIRGQLDARTNEILGSQMKGVRTEIDGENVANVALQRAGLPLVRSGGSGAAQTGQDESGGDYGAVNRVSGAYGKYQFMPDTWASTAKAHPELGLPFNMRQATPQQQEAAKQAFDGDNAKVLQANGVDPTAANIYLAHRFGAQGAVSFLKADPGAKVSSVVPANWAAQNPDLQGVTVGQFADQVQRRYGDKTAFGMPVMPLGDSGQPTTFKGDIKAAYQTAAADINNRTDLSPEVRASALAMINKTSTQVSSYAESATKALVDEADSYRLRGYLNPANLDPAKLGEFASRAQALGNQSLADTYRVYAAIAPALKDGLQAAPADTLKLLKSMEEGPAKKLLEGLGAGRDMTADATNAYDMLKKRQENGLSIGPDDLKKVAQQFADAGKPEKAREVADWGQGVLAANSALKLTPDQQTQVQQELKDIAAHGDITNSQVMLVDELRKGMARQAEAIQKDPLGNGSAALGLTLPPLNLNDQLSLAQRAAVARQVNAARPGAGAIPFTAPEIASLRDTLAKGSPDSNIALFQKLGALPDDMKLGTAATLANKGQADPLSQMYAAALAKFDNNDPVSQQAASEILRGAEILKNAGESQKKLAATSPVFQSALQDKIGNALALFGTTAAPSEMVEAIRASYAYRADKAGKQFDSTPDDTLLGQSIDAVTGGVIDFRGQKVFAPKPGATSYDLSAAVNRLRDSDLPDNLHSLEGKPVTADMIKSKGVLYSYGDNQYVVKLPDRGGELKPILDPRTGQAYVLGTAGLMDRQGGGAMPGDMRQPVPQITPLAAPSSKPRKP